MAEAYINPETRPAAATTTAAYTVPASTRTLISTIVIANDGAAAIARVTVAPLGAADATSQRIVPDVAVPAATVVGLTLGVTLKATDVVRVRSDTGNVNFILFGVEKT